MADRNVRYPQELRERAVRLVADMRVRIDGVRCVSEGASAPDAIMIAPGV